MKRCNGKTHRFAVKHEKRSIPSTDKLLNSIKSGNFNEPPSFWLDPWIERWEYQTCDGDKKCEGIGGL